MTKYWSNNIAIWSHWTTPLLKLSQVSFSLFWLHQRRRPSCSSQNISFDTSIVFWTFIFGLLKQTIQFRTTNQCEKMSSPSSMWSRDSNPQPLKHESSPITTGPGLQPKWSNVSFDYLAASFKNIFYIFAFRRHFGRKFC